jgi:hypothetical protein
MYETWIHPNRRALALGLILPALLLMAGAGGVAAGQLQESWLLRGMGIALGLMGLVLGAGLWRLIRQPRVAYQDGKVLLFVGAAEPIRMPVDVVECFFVGQAGGMIPDASGREAEVRTVILRLAESAQEWHHRDMKAALGHWCEGYVTIRGTWCEPITPELMKRLNHRLAELHRERKQQRAEVPT